MMNDMIHIGCEEMISAIDEAQMEHERGERERAARERQECWNALEAQFGPLHFRNGRFEYAEYEDMVWKD